MVHVSAQERSRRRDGSPTRSLRVPVQFSQRGFDPRRKAPQHQRPSRHPVLERGVGPQVGQHLEQVGLAASEEPADPRRILPRAVETGVVLFENPLQRVRELAFADERLQLGPQFRYYLGVFAGGKPRLPAVRQRRLQRIPVQQFANLHPVGSK